MCCRLQLSKEDIRKHVGGLFGNGDQTGSLQVVTISLPFLAQDCKAKLAEQPQNLPHFGKVRPFFKALEKWMDAIRDEQLWKRETVLEHFNKGFFQMAKANLKRGFKTYFTTIGFIGLWSALKS
jgi:ribonucleoside-triphosphate reductase